MQFRALYPCQFYLLLLPGAWRNESHAVTAARRRQRRRIAAARRIRTLQPLASSLPKKLLRQLEKTLLFFFFRTVELSVRLFKLVVKTFFLTCHPGLCAQH